jgi:hypothetical protein
MGYLTLVNFVLLRLPLDPVVHTIISIVDASLTVVFLLNFGARHRRAPNKLAYLLEQGGWLNFLGSLPISLLRLARIVRVVWVGGKPTAPRTAWVVADDPTQAR